MYKVSYCYEQYLFVCFFVYLSGFFHFCLGEICDEFMGGGIKTPELNNKE